MLPFWKRDKLMTGLDPTLTGKLQCTDGKPHHWVLESPKGPTSHGECKHCGAEKNGLNNSYQGTGMSAGTHNGLRELESLRETFGIGTEKPLTLRNEATIDA